MQVTEIRTTLFTILNNKYVDQCLQYSNAKTFSQHKRSARILEANEQDKRIRLRLPSRLWAHGLAVHCHHHWPHVSQHNSMSIAFCLCRQCDSRNLNLNPLCMLKAGSVPAIWTERVINIENQDNVSLIMSDSHWRWKRFMEPITAQFPHTSQSWPTQWGEGTRMICFSLSQR